MIITKNSESIFKFFILDLPVKTAETFDCYTEVLCFWTSTQYKFSS